MTSRKFAHDVRDGYRETPHRNNGATGHAVKQLCVCVCVCVCVYTDCGCFPPSTFASSDLSSKISTSSETSCREYAEEALQEQTARRGRGRYALHCLSHTPTHTHTLHSVTLTVSNSVTPRLCLWRAAVCHTRAWYMPDGPLMHSFMTASRDVDSSCLSFTERDLPSRGRQQQLQQPPKPGALFGAVLCVVWYTTCLEGLQSFRYTPPIHPRLSREETIAIAMV